MAVKNPLNTNGVAKLSRKTSLEDLDVAIFNNTSYIDGENTLLLFNLTSVSFLIFCSG